MELSQTAIHRLSTLASYMDTLHPRWPDAFNMRHWERSNWFCGTKCCAAGWGSTIPEFQRLGFRVAGDAPYFAGTKGWDAIEKFFEIDYKIAQHLFDYKWEDVLRTPQQWAEHCRTFLRENGVKDEQFQRFMAKAQEPVKV